MVDTVCKEYRNDSDYVDDIRKGGYAMNRATSALYLRYREEVVYHARKFTHANKGISEDIVDIVQDSFLLMIEKIRFGGYNDGSLAHFWSGITRGLLRNKLRRDARTDLIGDHTTLDQIDLFSPEHQMIDDERKVLIHKILDHLGPQCKKVLLMWASGYQMEEIAEEAGLSSEAMARKTKYKCKNKLIEFMKKNNNPISH